MFNGDDKSSVQRTVQEKEIFSIYNIKRGRLLLGGWVAELSIVVVQWLMQIDPCCTWCEAVNEMLSIANQHLISFINLYSVCIHYYKEVT